MESTPRSNRLHIALFGSTNSGKSSLLNALSGQQTAVVADQAGTTTDAVYKNMEINGLGACVLIDTPGLDDFTPLGNARRIQTEKAVAKADIAVLVFAGEPSHEVAELYERLKKRTIPVVAVATHLRTQLATEIHEQFGIECIPVDSYTHQGISALIDRLIILRDMPRERVTILGNLVESGDRVLLVMPQDKQAPEGRLILPQVQTLRELLDRRCVITCVAPEQLPEALHNMKDLPKLVITDSQVFAEVYDVLPRELLLTSFSILFAQYKGDVREFVRGAAAIASLTPQSRVLIAEACTHAPLSEDIGRVKIPAMLRKRVGNELVVEVVSGDDFPQDLSRYQLIIHCGGCMFNRRHVLNRIDAARRQGVAITNYGVTIAYLKNILDKVTLPD